MNRVLSAFTLLTAALAFPACASTRSPETSAPVFSLAQLLERMPPRDSIEARWVFSSLMAMGEDSLVSICNSLGRPGTETRAEAEYALQGLASYVTGPGREEERLIFVSALGKALKAVRPPEQSTFLIGRIQMAGKRESIGLLASFLNDERLCEPASQALVAIRDGADAPLLAALPASRGRGRVTLIKSLGDLRSPGAVTALVTEAASPDTAIRTAALYAVANIGDSRAGDVLSRAASDATGGYRDEILSWLLLFARRQAEAGNAAGALSIAEKLYARDPARAEDQTRAAALALIVETKGTAAIDDLTGAMADSSITLRSAALRLAVRIPGRSATLRWVALLESAANRSEIISMLGSRGDVSAYPAVVSALNDPGANVRACAVDAALRLKKEEALPVLLSLLERSW